MITPSGGGFGDPFARCVALVGDEVADGLLTAEQARQAYGVVLVDGAIDAEATAGVRAMARAPSSAFSLGPARLAIEAVWPAAARAALATAALRAPDGVRGHALLALRNMLTAGPHPVTEAAVHSAAEQYFGGSRGGYSSSSSS
jgi:N-methylhydantoinase B